jgi:S-adenosylmethionine decarboxylase
MLRITQLLVDLYGCEADLDDEGFLLDTLERASNAVGSTVLQKITQRFSPVGVSAILILAETHMSIHTWPEHSYAAVDVFICGEGKDPHRAWEVLADRIKPKSYEMNELVRTIGEKRSKDS